MLNSLKVKILLGGVVCSLVLLSVVHMALPIVFTQDDFYSSEIQPVFAQQSQIFDTLSLAELFEQSELGVVSISVTKTSYPGSTASVASGFVFDKAGHIITNNHVVENTKKNICNFC